MISLVCDISTIFKAINFIVNLYGYVNQSPSYYKLLAIIIQYVPHFVPLSLLMLC